MTERPIIFSAPMVRAILSGTKTQTRRAIKYRDRADSYTSSRFRDDIGWQLQVGHYNVYQSVKVPYAVGDRLWVREAFALVGTIDPGWLLYRASGYDAECERHGFSNFPPESEVKWRPSIHMPRWASRITLEVTAVKVERLQDISEADAKAEGAWPPDGYKPGTRGDFIGGFAYIWESIHGPGAWEANPWVVAITFRKVD